MTRGVCAFAGGESTSDSEEDDTAVGTAKSSAKSSVAGTPKDGSHPFRTRFNSSRKPWWLASQQVRASGLLFIVGAYRSAFNFWNVPLSAGANQGGDAAREGAGGDEAGAAAAPPRDGGVLLHQLAGGAAAQPHRHTGANRTNACPASAV